MFSKQTAERYTKDGYIKLPKFFVEAQLSHVKELVEVFHHGWCNDNLEFYNNKAINSSGLTSRKYLSKAQRLALFKLISDERLLGIVKQLIPKPTFMGTQLFFNPISPTQLNYWHRDPQYHLSVEEQKLALQGPEVLHVRIPLADEPGIEVVPGSHKNWDNDQELRIRLEKEGHTNSENLPRGVELPLKLGDVLIFSANMIHRGLYGGNRLALDILYCERALHLTEFIQLEHQPSTEMLSSLERSLFL